MLTVGMAGIPSIPPGSFRIIGAHIAAGIWSTTDLALSPINVSCTIELQLAQQGSWGGGSIPLYGEGARPGLSNSAEAELDITGWIVDLQPGDQLPYVLSEFVGTATVVTLTLDLKRIAVTGIDSTSLVDDGAVTLTDSSGRTLVNRT